MKSRLLLLLRLLDCLLAPGVPSHLASSQMLAQLEVYSSHLQFTAKAAFAVNLAIAHAIHNTSMQYFANLIRYPGNLGGDSTSETPCSGWPETLGRFAGRIKSKSCCTSCIAYIQDCISYIA